MAKENTPPAGQALAEQFAAWALALDDAALPQDLRDTVTSALIDHAGLAVSARHEEYVQAIVTAWEGEGGCTAFGHARGYDAAGAALINGTASHGEDYDDTFEGTPVHTSAVIVPAVLAACERHGASGVDALRGIAVGAELMCRMAIVAPTAQHRAGFHPTAIIGAVGAAAGVSTALRFSPTQFVDSLGIAASFASGIIEYLAEGTWTKRIHPGWAAQAGLRAASLGRAGFKGPRTVFEGEHGFFYAFGIPEIHPDHSRITTDLGRDWKAARIAFKPYACGTMVQPFIDCAIRLAREGVKAEEVEDVLCKVGEGTVHRLWEPLAEKRRPSTPYSAKFSVPFGVAAGFVDKAAGLGQFTEQKISDADILALAAKVSYEIDPNDEYPRNYTGSVIATLRDGSVHSTRQPHMRGGAREPLSREEILAKFRANTQYGGWTDGQADALAQWCERVFDASSLAGIEKFRA